MCRHIIITVSNQWGPEPHTPPLTYCIRVYSILFHTGKGGGGRVQPERRLEGQQFTKLSRKYQHDWLYLLSINSHKHLPQSPLLVNFLNEILLRYLYSWLVMQIPPKARWTGSSYFCSRLLGMRLLLSSLMWRESGGCRHCVKWRSLYTLTRVQYRTYSWPLSWDCWSGYATLGSHWIKLPDPD